MIRKVNICIAIIMAIVLFLQPSHALTISIDRPNQESPSVVISIICNDTNIDLSTITAKIYSAKNVYSETELGYYQFNETYEFSKTADSLGIISFQRPSDYCSITFDLDSLPDNYGISEHTRFLHPNELSYTFFLEKIDAVELEQESGQYYPVFKNSSGELVYTTANIEEVPCNPKETIFDNSSERKFTFTKEFQVTYPGNSQLITATETYAYENDLEKAVQLYSLGVISEDAYIEKLANYVLEGSQDDVSVDSTTLHEVLKNYTESAANNTTVKKRAEQALTVLGAPLAATTTTTYASSVSGRFRVYYDSTGITYNAAKAVADELDKIHTLFCEQWGLLSPSSDASTNFYRIELLPTLNVNTVENTSASGLTKSNGTLSYIQLTYGCANGVLNSNLSQHSGTLAHEYMHAIMFCYGITGSDDATWMHESFASFAGVIYNANYAFNQVTAISQFLESPHLSLTYFETSEPSRHLRHYGSLLFPLYIYEEMGGYATIKSIYQACNAGEDILPSIDEGLQDRGYSLEDAFTGCATYNYDPEYYYNVTNHWNKATAQSFTSYPHSTSVSMGTFPLACCYNTFVAPNIASSTLTITINYEYIPSGSIPKMSTILKSSEDIYTARSHSISNNRCTIVQSNFGSNSAKELTVIAINAGTSGTISYNRTATLSGQKVKVTLDALGGSCSVSSKTLTPGGTYGTLPTPTKANATFLGWENDAREEVTPSSIVPDTNQTIYARWATHYKITNLGANKCLNIYGDNVTSLTNGINVTLWSDSGTNEQIWLIERLGPNQYVRSIIDMTYGLNVYRSGNPYNCNIYKIAGNETDATIDFIWDEETNKGYKIKLSNYNLYLTVGSSSNGTNVYWATESSSNYQFWTIEPIS